MAVRENFGKTELVMVTFPGQETNTKKLLQLAFSSFFEKFGCTVPYICMD